MKEALSCFEEAKELYQAVEDRQGQAHCIHSIGEIEQHRGQTEEALRRFEDAKELYQMVEDRLGLAHCIRGIGKIEQHRGRMEEALRHFEEAKELYQMVEDRLGLAHCIRSIGEIEQHRGQMEEALGCFEEAKELYQVVEYQPGQAHCIRSIGEIEQHRGQMDEALSHFEEAKELYQVVEDRQGQAHCIRSIGAIEQHRGRMEEALSRFEDAKELYLLAQDLGGQLNCLFNISTVYTGDSQSVFKAIDVLQEAVNLSKAVGGYYEARSRQNLAQLLFQSSQYPVAREEEWYDGTLYGNSDVEGTRKNLSRGLVKDRFREFSLPRKLSGKPFLAWEIDGKAIGAASSSHSISRTSKVLTSGLPHGMSPRKAHEVDRFIALAQTLLSNEPQIKSAIDIGSGRAHLSAALTREPLLLDVCAIEGSSSQVTGAEKLVSNRLKYNKEEEEKRGMLTLKAEVLDENGIRKILQEGRAEKEEGRLVCALHACGDLTVDTLRAFVSSASAECQDVLIAIGCCYNLTSSSGVSLTPI
ncbi:TPR-like protein [Atractiella rhizophila]|nr:TPR-like protein [Atractiella rhizophila]